MSSNRVSGGDRSGRYGPIGERGDSREKGWSSDERRGGDPPSSDRDRSRNRSSPEGGHHRLDCQVTLKKEGLENKVILLSGLPRNVHEGHVRSVTDKLRGPRPVDILIKRKGRVSQGFAFMEFKSLKKSRMWMETNQNNLVIHGKRIEVRYGDIQNFPREWPCASVHAGYVPPPEGHFQQEQGQFPPAWQQQPETFPPFVGNGLPGAASEVQPLAPAAPAIVAQPAQLYQPVIPIPSQPVTKSHQSVVKPDKEEQQPAYVCSELKETPAASTTETTATTANTVAPETSGYQYDEESGYFFNPENGLYYDPSSQFYYNAEEQQYFIWDSYKLTHVPVPDDAMSKDTNKKEERGKSAGHEDVKITDWKKLLCLLCQRQFDAKEALLRHQQLSDLHKQNIEDLKRRLSTETKFKKLERSENKMKYRDRAAERRDKQNAAEASAQKQECYEPPTTPIMNYEEPHSISLRRDPKRIKILQSMRWLERLKGMGRHRRANTSPALSEPFPFEDQGHRHGY